VQHIEAAILIEFYRLEFFHLCHKGEF
jgi:hypothetical protein